VCDLRKRTFPTETRLFLECNSMWFVCAWITLEVNSVSPIFNLSLLNYVCHPGLNTQNSDGMQRACTGAHLFSAQIPTRIRCIYYGISLISKQDRHNLMMRVFRWDFGFRPLFFIFCAMMCRLHLHLLTK